MRPSLSGRVKTRLLMALAPVVLLAMGVPSQHPVVAQAVDKEWEGDPIERANFWRARNGNASLFDLARIADEASKVPEASALPQRIGSGGGVPTVPGPAWTPQGPAPIASSRWAGRVRAIAVDPVNPNLVYAGAASGGIWKSVDGGDHWSPMVGEGTSPTLEIGSIAIDPNNRNVIYAGTGEPTVVPFLGGRGILKSTDAAASWRLVGGNGAPFFPGTITYRVLVGPGGVLWVASSQGLYKSTGGGESNWSKVGSAQGLVDVAVSDVAISPDGNTMFASGNGAGVYRSVNGAPWQRLNGLPSFDLARLAVGGSNPPLGSNPQVVYVLGLNQSTPVVYFSTNNGTSWSLVSGNVLSLGDSYRGYNLEVAVDPHNSDILYVGLLELGVNADATKPNGVWRNISQFLSGGPIHADQHAIAFRPCSSSPCGYFLGTDGGVYRLTPIGADPAANIIDIKNNDLAITQFVGGDLGINFTSDPHAVGGTQDNGTLMYRPVSAPGWQQVLGGDGGYSYIDHTLPSFSYETIRSTFFSFIRASDYGAGPQDLNNGLDLSALRFYPFYAPDRTDRNHLAMVTERGVYEFQSTGWYRSSMSQAFSTLAFAPGHPETIYGYSNGAVYRTQNAHSGGLATWTLRGSIAGINSLMADENDPNLVYAAGSSSISVRKSTNGGSSWTNISGNLPVGLPVQSIVKYYVSGATGVLVIGATPGVFFSTNEGASWTALRSGLPNVVVTQLALDRDLTTLAAFTYGRGVFTTSIAGGQANTNLALNKPAIQSTTAYGGVAGRAVDGNTSGSFGDGHMTHTGIEVQPWWQVDLGAIQSIQNIKVYNRTECCSGRLDNSWVLVSDVPFVSNNLGDIRNQPGVSQYPIVVAGSTNTLQVDRTGRYVRIQLDRSDQREFSLAEVEVLGTSSAPPPANLALNKPATQSSTAYGGNADKGVDGNSSGFFGDGHMTHTGLEVQPWWEVNLGSIYTIQTIVVSNRTECCMDRLDNSFVFVSNEPLVGRSLSDILGDCNVLRYTISQMGAVMTLTVNQPGQYVRVQLSDLNAKEFSLAEVAVIGPSSTPPPVNVGLNKQASQSSTAYGGTADKGVDGNSSGFFGDGHMTHTGMELQPWWEVNLGGAYTIQTINLYSRTECCTGRLDDSWVFVSNTPLAGRSLADIRNDCSVMRFHIFAATSVITVPTNRRGQYLRVQLDGSVAREFSLAEVEVLGSN